MPSGMSTTASKKEESPLTNIMINVLIPVIVLSQMSKDPMMVDDPKMWHLGPYKALLVALLIPLGYGIFHLSLIHI